MPFFTVGFALGALVCKGVRTILKSYSLSKEDSEGQEDVLDISDTKEEPITLYRDPCETICKFSNVKNNCWMNSSLQATLHLKVVQEKLFYQSPESVQSPTITPGFEQLFLRALQNPGTEFNAADILVVLQELSTYIPSLYYQQNNDPLDLLNPLLSWFEQYEIENSIQVKEYIKCQICHFTRCRIINLGRIYFLPTVDNSDTISSLLNRSTRDCQSQGTCPKCGYRTTLERRQVWICTDILILYLPRVDRYGQMVRHCVTPSEVIEIPLGDNRTQAYRLSSVISHSGSDSNSGHFWSDLFFDHITIKASDCHISSTAGSRPAEIQQSGIIYIYEL